MLFFRKRAEMPIWSGAGISARLRKNSIGSLRSRNGALRPRRRYRLAVLPQACRDAGPRPDPAGPADPPADGRPPLRQRVAHRGDEHPVAELPELALRAPEAAEAEHDGLDPGRHFVNGHPLKGPYPPGIETVVFGLGCFWGAERKLTNTPSPSCQNLRSAPQKQPRPNTTVSIPGG
jgi:hypothetical protein